MPERGGSAPQLTSHCGESDVRGRTEDLKDSYEAIEVQRVEVSLEMTLGTE